eukprot:1287867-Rhodomonas_salina.2
MPSTALGSTITDCATHSRSRQATRLQFFVSEMKLVRGDTGPSEMHLSMLIQNAAKMVDVTNAWSGFFLAFAIVGLGKGLILASCCSHRGSDTRSLAPTHLSCRMLAHACRMLAHFALLSKIQAFHTQNWYVRDEQTCNKTCARGRLAECNEEAMSSTLRNEEAM